MKLTEEQKVTMKEGQAAAKKVAAAPKVLAAIKRFKPRVQKLSASARDLLAETRSLAADLVEFLEPSSDAAGKKLVSYVLRACDAESTVALYTVRFAACVLAVRAGHSIGTLWRKADGAKEFADVPATVDGIQTVAELNSCAQSANRALGVKPRGRRAAAKKDEKTFGMTEALAVITERMKAFPISTAGELSKVLAPFGYRVVEVKSEQPAEQQAEAPAPADGAPPLPPRARVRRAA